MFLYLIYSAAAAALGVAAAGAGVAAVVAAAAGAAEVAALLAAGVAVLAAGLLPSLKSVAYQPEPLSWKPAAVSCFSIVALPQALHSGAGALIFCSTSSAWPQAGHLYA